MTYNKQQIKTTIGLFNNTKLRLSKYKERKIKRLRGEKKLASYDEVINQLLNKLERLNESSHVEGVKNIEISKTSETFIEDNR